MRLEFRRRNVRLTLLALAAALVLSGCGRNMYDQPRYRTYDASPYFPDGMSARPLLEGTIPRKRGGVPERFYTGQGPEGFLSELPESLGVTMEVLQVGQDRYNVYCVVCHNYNGNGLGIVVQKGAVRPTSFHEQRLLDAPVGYFFSAMTNGFGRMYPYASRISPEDRWAIAAYVKALQLSQNAFVEDIPEGVAAAVAGEDAP